MTAVLERPAGAPQWSSMPGWGIVGDLTPPELIAARRMHVLRRIIAAALLLVVLLCGAGFFYATVKHSKATDEMDAATGQSTALQVETSRYSGITRIEAVVGGIKSQLASALLYDVDVAKLVGKMRAALPNTMSIGSLTVTLNNPSASTSSGTSSSLDLSGATHIGTVTITGAGQDLEDLPNYVEGLAAIPGVVDVVPTNNTRASQKGGAASYTVNLTLTDKLYSHHFDSTATTDEAGH